MSGNSWNLTRRRFLAFAAAAGTALSTRAAWALDNPFAQLPAATLPQPNGPLRWLDSGDQKGVFFKQFLPLYGKARGIEIVYDGLPWNEIDTVLPLGISNGTAPDAFNLPTTLDPAAAVAQGWVRPIDDLIPDFENWKAAFPNGTFVEGLTVFGGKTYGFSYSTARRLDNGLLFNRPLLSEAGYDWVGTDNRTLSFDELRDAAAKITANSGGRVPGFIIGGSQINQWSNTVLALAQRAGAHLGTTTLGQGLDFTTGEYAFAHDAVVQAVELLLALRDDGSVFPGSVSITAPQARALVPQGAAGLIIQGPWNIPIWEAEHPEFDFGFAPTPTPPELDNPVYIGQLVNNVTWLNANAKNPEYTADFFRWLGTEEGQIAYAGVVGAADPAIFPQASQSAPLSERSKLALRLAEEKVRVAPNPIVRNSELTKVVTALVEPTPNLAQTIQGLYAGELSGVKANLQILADARNKALDDAIAAAKAGGANVSRGDFVFANWDPLSDYGPEGYAAL